MSDTAQLNYLADPLAHASATPDVHALVTEFQYVQENGSAHTGKIARAEDVRLNRWVGKSQPPDGCRWQANQPQGKTVRPYDGAPDTDVNLADELVGAEVDILMSSLLLAQLGAKTTHLTPLTAAQVAELTAVGRYVQGAIAEDLADDAELLAQMTATLGWSVLNPGWLERWELVKRTVTMDEIQQQAATAPPGSTAAQLPAMILDESLEPAALEVAQMLFPHLDKTKLRQAIRDLRSTGTAEFLDKQLAEKRPTIRTLIQGYNLFVSGATGKVQSARGYLIIERYYQAELESVGASIGWNPEFVEAVKTTAGVMTHYGDRLRLNVTSHMQDLHDKSIEIWTTMVRQFDPETGAAGIYCTTFSPHLKPSVRQSEDEETEARYYAAHYLLDYAHGKYPLIQSRREVIGPALDDSRGIPEMVRSDQKVIKSLQDATVARMHLETDPPRAFIGAGWSKVNEANLPGGRVSGLMSNMTITELNPQRGNPQMADAAIIRTENGSRRRFAFPNTMDGSHPSSWQARQARIVKRWLLCHELALWQLIVLAYQNFSTEEIGLILGRAPQLTVDDVLQHRVTLKFDPRSLDSDWVKATLEFVVQLLGIDSGGLMDRGPIIQIALSYIDPTLVTSIMKNPAGASAALYRQVEQDISSIMLGNPPQLREGDASSGMQMQMAYAVLGKNPDYQQRLQGNERVKANIETYLKNLQHNVQETQLSPQQGRLGVQAQPQKPVQSGAGGGGDSIQ